MCPPHIFTANFLFKVHQEAHLKLKELTEKFGKEEDFELDLGSDLDNNFEDLDISQSDEENNE